MSGRNAALLGALAMIALLGFLTVSVAVDKGVDVVVILSLLILAVIGFGVFGALRNPPNE